MEHKTRQQKYLKKGEKSKVYDPNEVIKIQKRQTFEQRETSFDVVETQTS